MAQLPNGERARIPTEKFTDDCLHPDHPRGKDQARVCAAVLGITRDSANALAALVRQAAVPLGSDWHIPTADGSP